MNGGVKEYDQVYQAYYATEDNQERKYTMFTLGSTLDMGLKKKTLDWAIKSGDVKLQDLFYPIGAVSGNVAGSELAWSYYKEVKKLHSCFPISDLWYNLFLEL